MAYGSKFEKWDDASLVGKRDTAIGEIRLRLSTRLLVNDSRRTVSPNLVIQYGAPVVLQAQFGDETDPGIIDGKRFRVIARMAIDPETQQWAVRHKDGGYLGSRLTAHWDYDGGWVKKDFNFKGEEHWGYPIALPLKQRETLFEYMAGAANSLTADELRAAYLVHLEAAYQELTVSETAHVTQADLDVEHANTVRLMFTNEEARTYSAGFRAYLQAHDGVPS